nr:O-acyltransferase WSD1-like [Tanacetum cinerariifolium]
TINDVVLGVTQAGISRYLHRRYSEEHNGNAAVPDNIRLRATFFFNLRATTKIEDFTDMNIHGTWGNKIGYALLPLNIGLKKDPLDNVRDAKAIMERKKASLKPLFTYFLSNLLLKLFGINRTLLPAVMANHHYMDKVTFVLSVDEETIPDPHKLCDDLQESLNIIKTSAQVTLHDF